MKQTIRKIFLTAMLGIAMLTGANAQITITAADMPNAGDTFRISTASVLSAIDLSLTGPAYTWNFSSLQSTGQDVDTFLAIGNTGLIYSLFYVNIPFNNNRASIASRGFDLSGLGSFPNVPVSDIYNFYYETSADFKQVGFGATLSGIQTPIAYTNKDVIYNFPLNFGDVDSSDSDYTLSVPNIFSITGSQRRVNEVDGWGSITTPYGTFNAIRVKSVLNGQDSAFLDTLGQSFSFTRPTIREYKWLANGEGIPVLQVNTSELLGVEAITSIRYRDSLRVPVGLSEPEQAIASMRVFPNPGHSRDLRLVVNMAGQGLCQLAIHDLQGRTHAGADVYLKQGPNNIALEELTRHLEEGFYLLTLQQDGAGQNIRFYLAR